ncbi:hypothetical protein WN51_07242 [Melipona quadrifasciata]|uniref:Uncharacterized protein n=1 Tax=Melipona quadrifasciata TaxID=166423 RepID=A0A0M9A878_9HYME|nr:hypothetical protein WN51_07242 [Melipona quadrifasciata]
MVEGGSAKDGRQSGYKCVRKAHVQDRGVYKRRARARKYTGGRKARRTSEEKVFAAWSIGLPTNVRAYVRLKPVRFDARAYDFGQVRTSVCSWLIQGGNPLTGAEEGREGRREPHAKRVTKLPDRREDPWVLPLSFVVARSSSE